MTLWLAFHAVQFAPGENPSTEAGFTVQGKNPFPTEHLLGDGRSRAIVELVLLQVPPGFVVTDSTSLAVADQGWTGGEGTIVLALSDPEAGTLTFQGQKGATLRFPVSGVGSGKTALTLAASDAIVFTAGRKVAAATLTARIEGCSSYDFLPDLKIPATPRQKGYKHALTTGVREFGALIAGYDALKAQWYLKRFGFLAHDIEAVNAKGLGNAWTGIADMSTSGKLSNSEAVAVKEFQLVSLSTYRNATTRIQTVTYDGVPSNTVTIAAALEMALWEKAGYKVKPYHGDAQLNVASPARELEGKIAYGVLHDEAKPLGYLDLKQPIGESVVVLPDATIEVAGEMKCAVRLFDRDRLIWRLHDADPSNRLTHPLFHPGTAALIKKTIGIMRKRQAAAYGGVDSLDPMLGLGYRSYAEQDDCYKLGRTVRSEKVCGCRYPSQPSNPCPLHGASPCHCLIDFGNCLKTGSKGWDHRMGRKWVTNAHGGESWHCFGMAIDVNYYFNSAGTPEDGGDRQNVMGQIAKDNGMDWGGDFSSPDPGHISIGGLGQRPENPVRQAHDQTQGDEKAKLEAVWRSLGV